MMNKIFAPYLDKFTVVFIDDVLIYSRSREEHEQLLRTFLQLLRHNQLYVQLRKYDFWLKKVVFLGHIISKDGLAADPAKIEVVVNWERLKNVSEIWSLLGLAGYYCKFM